MNAAINAAFLMNNMFERIIIRPFGQLFNFMFGGGVCEICFFLLASKTKTCLECSRHMRVK